MTLDEIRALPDRELDRVIAEALGIGCRACGARWPCAAGMDERAAESNGYSVDLEHHQRKTALYSADLNACAEAERAGFLRAPEYSFPAQYIQALNESIESATGLAYSEWCLLRATARQRAEALAVVLTEARK